MSATNQALRAFSSAAALTDIDAHGALKSRARRRVEDLTSVPVLNEDGTMETLPVNVLSRPETPEGWLVPPEPNWMDWVVERLEGLSLREIAVKHSVPLDVLTEYFTEPGEVQQLWDRLHAEEWTEMTVGLRREVMALLRSEEKQDRYRALRVGPEIWRLRGIGAKTTEITVQTEEDQFAIIAGGKSNG